MTGRAAIGAGLAYGSIGFALGFAFGVVRTLFVVPALGVFLAVAIETPLMLGFCAPLAVWCMRRWGIAGRVGAGLLGLTGFAALMACEVLLGLALEQTPQAMLAAMGKPAGLLGLAGQVCFALIPLGFVAPQRSPRE